MKLISIASSFPEHSYTQRECLQAMKTADFWSEIKVGSRRLLEKVLESDTGISERRFALENISDAWQRNAEELNRDYEHFAPAIAEQAVRKVLADTGLEISELDALFVCSCTGYLCPGVSSHLAEKLGMRENAYLQDLTGLGCGAAIPMLHAAAGFTQLHPEARVLTVAVEICSAAFYIEDDAGVLISTCIFGDGASASLWCGEQREEGTWRVENFQSIHRPEHREMIRFTNASGKLRNQLHKDVPQLAATTVKQLYDKRNTKSDVVVTHGGGRDVILALEEALSIPNLRYAREVMEKYGNLSSPSVMIALENCLQHQSSAPDLWMCTFGAGFSAHSCEISHLT